MKALKLFLGIYDWTDEQYQGVDGSCQWIDARDDFQEWRESVADIISRNAEADEANIKDNSIFWIHANPGTGKTHLASHVISGLQSQQLECAYHYFHTGSKASESLGCFLRSIAYQMAISNASVCERLLTLYHDGSAFDLDDALTIWNKLFKKGIYQVR